MRGTHTAWLNANVAPILQRRTTWVDLNGYASKLGTPESNQLLSERRCKSVRLYVSGFADQVTFRTEHFAGESESAGDKDDNDGYWRSVEILVYERQPPAFRRIPERTEVVSVRRITHRSYSRVKSDVVNQTSTDPNEMQQKEMVDLLVETLTGDRPPGQWRFLGDEETARRRVASFPSGYRVNRVIFNTDETFQTMSWGGLTVTITTIEYQWQPPLPFIEVITAYRVTANGQAGPPGFTSTWLPRRIAQRTPLVIPPSP